MLTEFEKRVHAAFKEGKSKLSVRAIEKARGINLGYFLMKNSEPRTSKLFEFVERGDTESMVKEVLRAKRAEALYREWLEINC